MSKAVLSERELVGIGMNHTKTNENCILEIIWTNCMSFQISSNFGFGKSDNSHFQSVFNQLIYSSTNQFYNMSKWEDIKMKHHKLPRKLLYTKNWWWSRDYDGVLRDSSTPENPTGHHQYENTTTKQRSSLSLISQRGPVQEGKLQLKSKHVHWCSLWATTEEWVLLRASRIIPPSSIWVQSCEMGWAAGYRSMFLPKIPILKVFFKDLCEYNSTILNGMRREVTPAGQGETQWKYHLTFLNILWKIILAIHVQQCVEVHVGALQYSVVFK